ncbi:hypothetical protein E9531_08395 [Lampropedia puyangensis]|uniref:Uncharacterized protein n=1 Tax=Lampropedia puyangensis TaxID=1330072 RepID=A0A4S8F3R6_9BURK|nr:hypothetical protein [Lampropedia puyangensis]THU02008.1 hypothetical protein E9531_08395 [Lampropedia puyangensis]
MVITSVIAALVWWQKGQIAVWALVRTDPIPEVQQMVDRGLLADADQYLGFFMDYDYVRNNPQAQQLQETIAEKRSSSLYQLQKIGEGLALGHSDESAGQIASVISDLMVIGDLRDLAVQGWHWSQDEATDPVLIALASIGVAASAAQLGAAAATVPTAGASTAVTVSATTAKTALTTLKTMRRLNKLPDWIGSSLITTARQIRQQRSWNGLVDAQTLLTDVTTLSRVPGGAKLLEQTRDAVSLAQAARFARLQGSRTQALVHISADALPQTMRMTERYGAQAVALAATFGKQGLHVLDSTGAVAFAKYSARATKLAYKGDAFRVLARWLTQLSSTVLALLTLPGLLAIWPRKRSKRHKAMLTPP